jgi:hypothetical protein
MWELPIRGKLPAFLWGKKLFQNGIVRDGKLTNAGFLLLMKHESTFSGIELGHFQHGFRVTVFAVNKKEEENTPVIFGKVGEKLSGKSAIHNTGYDFRSPGHYFCRIVSQDRYFEKKNRNKCFRTKT